MQLCELGGVIVLCCSVCLMPRGRRHYQAHLTTTTVAGSTTAATPAAGRSMHCCTVGRGGLSYVRFGAQVLPGAEYRGFTRRCCPPPRLRHCCLERGATHHIFWKVCN